MATNTTVYSGQWGDIIDRPQDDCVEIRWFDTTTDMSGEDFNEFLATYAGHIEACGRGGGLVDAPDGFRQDERRLARCEHHPEVQRGWHEEIRLHPARRCTADRQRPSPRRSRGFSDRLFRFAHHGTGLD